MGNSQAAQIEDKKIQAELAYKIAQLEHETQRMTVQAQEETKRIREVEETKRVGLTSPAPIYFTDHIKNGQYISAAGVLFRDHPFEASGTAVAAYFALWAPFRHERLAPYSESQWAWRCRVYPPLMKIQMPPAQLRTFVLVVVGTAIADQMVRLARIIGFEIKGKT